MIIVVRQSPFQLTQTGYNNITLQQHSSIRQTILTTLVWF